MTTRHLEVLVEEESMEALLDSLLPRLAPGVSFAIRRFQGKHDLLQKLPQRMGGATERRCCTDGGSSSWWIETTTTAAR